MIDLYRKSQSSKGLIVAFMEVIYQLPACDITHCKCQKANELAAIATVGGMRQIMRNRDGKKGSEREREREREGERERESERERERENIAKRYEQSFILHQDYILRRLVFPIGATVIYLNVRIMKDT